MSSKTRKRKSDNDAAKEAAIKKIKRTALAHGVVKVEETQRDELERLLNGNTSNDAPPTPTSRCNKQTNVCNVSYRTFNIFIYIYLTLKMFL